MDNTSPISEPPLPLVRGLVLAIFGTNGRLVETGNHLVRPLGLTTAWWQVLGGIGYAPAPLPVAHIARNMGLTRQAVQRVVDVLATHGLVRFATNPHHQRAKLVVLTDAGSKALRDAEAAAAALDQTILERIGAARLSAALTVLTDLAAILAEHATDTPATPDTVTKEDA
ncbi:MarR family winged helix-turn-helix transcriptional regulator [Xanthomonas maliensis]|uniref:MarR family winged helix-turn-helix transcriptional regulator n=1 Tax=Xanthomonas maliensis TaxID=1321368 RepID=UPI0003B6826B|nr:helix-turn-helix domain-containing protein [Xanthomonas maliensis]KAB7766497.1 MarR family transcriptional regulator [Xanthomonas maliensis]